MKKNKQTKNQPTTETDGKRNGKRGNTDSFFFLPFFDDIQSRVLLAEPTLIGDWRPPMKSKSSIKKPATHVIQVEMMISATIFFHSTFLFSFPTVAGHFLTENSSVSSFWSSAALCPVLLKQFLFSDFNGQPRRPFPLVEGAKVDEIAFFCFDESVSLIGHEPPARWEAGSEATLMTMRWRSGFSISVLQGLR